MRVGRRPESLAVSRIGSGIPLALRQGTEVTSMRVALGVCAVTAVLVTYGSGEWPVELAAAGSTIRVPAGGKLQDALNAAQPGDTILLQAGATYTGNFVLPAKSGTSFITVQTDIVAAGALAPGVRLTPAAASSLARIQSPSTVPALKTKASSHHWRLQLLQFGPNATGFGDIIEIGDGSSAQNSLSIVPYSFVLDRLYVYGDPLMGQKRGIAINAKDVTVTNSTIRDIKAVGQDAQALGAYNGPGPFLIENNYLEASGENFLLGGADPPITGLIPGNVTFRRNYVTKPVSWRNPILSTPANVAVSGGPSGSLPAGTFSYRVVARRAAGPSYVAQSTPSAAKAVAVPPAGQVKITWSAVSTATEYRVYRTGDGTSVYWTVTQPIFIDSGIPGTAGNVATAGTVWTGKNLFELKNAHDVVVEQNVFENNWKEAQTGYAIVLTVRNSGGACTWCTIQNVEFRHNIVRHVASGVNILGYDDPSRPSVQAANLNFRDNLFYDVDTKWGGQGFFLQLGDAPKNVIVDHNTIDHTGGILVSVYGGTATAPRQIVGFKYTNNLSRHGSYGVMGTSLAYGISSITAYFPNTTFQRNLLSGGSPSRYPLDNFFAPDFNTLFANRATGDYRLLPGGPFANAGTDGRDLGAEMGTVLALMSSDPPPPLPTAPSAPQRLRFAGR